MIAALRGHESLAQPFRVAYQDVSDVRAALRSAGNNWYPHGRARSSSSCACVYYHSAGSHQTTSREPVGCLHDNSATPMRSAQRPVIMGQSCSQYQHRRVGRSDIRHPCPCHMCIVVDARSRLCMLHPHHRVRLWAGRPQVPPHVLNICRRHIKLVSHAALIRQNVEHMLVLLLEHAESCS